MKKNIQSFWIFLLLSLSSNSIYSQNGNVPHSLKEFSADFYSIHNLKSEPGKLYFGSSIDSILYDDIVPKKHFWRASAELMLCQIVPWSYNYYVRDAEFAHITWESIGHNLKLSSWEWDDNSFSTNQFAHPYHGSLYFSAFRTNGYNFWQSAPAAFAGSFIWEVFGETHPPAQNDFINTSLGGISIGEMTYRISNMIVNNEQMGFKRQANEVLGFLVSPLNGLNRILDGKWGRYQRNAIDRRPSTLNGNLDLGLRRFSEKVEDVLAKGDNEFYARMNVEYGNILTDYEKPFSNFSIILELGQADSTTLNNVQINAALYGNEMNTTEKGQQMLVVTMNYDYIHNTKIQYGGQSFSAKIMGHWNYGLKSTLLAEGGLIGVVLGSVPDDYLYYGEGRNYDYGPGAGLLAGGFLNVGNKFWVKMNYKGVWFHTLNGNESDFFLHTFTTDFRYFLTQNISTGLTAGYFRQDSYYANYDDVFRDYPFGRIFLGFNIGSR